jgi:protein FRG1
MVSKLTFKGDKPTKKRKRSSKPAASSTPTTTSVPDDIEDDGTLWTTMTTTPSIRGPCMLIPPATPQITSTSLPLALSSDTEGTLFFSPLTLNLDNDPLTSEPSDVAEVLILAEVPGRKGRWSVKSAYGRYLSCDKNGLVFCERTAVGAEEEWGFERIAGPGEEPAEGGEEEDDDAVRWAIRSFTTNKYLSVEAGGKGKGKSGDKGKAVSLVSSSGEEVAVKQSVNLVVRGDKDEVGDTELWIVRGQTGYKENKKKVKEEKKQKERITRRELEELTGLKLDEDQVRALKRAKRGELFIRYDCSDGVRLTFWYSGQFQRGGSRCQGKVWKARQVCLEAYLSSGMLMSISQRWPFAGLGLVSTCINNNDDSARPGMPHNRKVPKGSC